MPYTQTTIKYANMDLSFVELSAYVNNEDIYAAMTFSIGSLETLPNTTIVGIHYVNLSFSDCTLLDLRSVPGPVAIIVSFWVVVLSYLAYKRLISPRLTPTPAAERAPVSPVRRTRRRV